ncbi:hypothetical protein PORY_002803 [Pneumocystis oryctolagi]|uniref:Uncharacterized protein n=1 Tax=Pneumocystis oryctolagi TaxID=42067 RepID=A0ACB7C9W8_9ASCO|nr:hypothetical protein PORY_002803 [Pneumocystis oryctolagi]
MSTLLYKQPNKKVLSMFFVGVGSAGMIYYIYRNNCKKNEPKGKFQRLERKAEHVYDSVSSHVKDVYNSGKKQINDIEKSCEKKVHNLIDKVDIKVDKIKDTLRK